MPIQPQQVTHVIERGDTIEAKFDAGLQVTRDVELIHRASEMVCGSDRPEGVALENVDNPVGFLAFRAAVPGGDDLASGTLSGGGFSARSTRLLHHFNKRRFWKTVMMSMIVNLKHLWRELPEIIWQETGEHVRKSRKKANYYRTIKHR